MMSEEPKEVVVDDLSPATIHSSKSQDMDENEAESDHSPSETVPTTDSSNNLSDAVEASNANCSLGVNSQTPETLAKIVQDNLLPQKAEEEECSDDEDVLEHDARPESEQDSDVEAFRVTNAERPPSANLPPDEPPQAAAAAAASNHVDENSSAAGNRQASPDEDMSVYHIKWVQFHNKQVPIVTQNENGPCPLIAIANVLLLRQVIKLPPNTELVTSQQIIEYFGDYLLSTDMKNLSNEQMANFQQNMNDAFTLFPKLQTGLDMNLRFSGARDFEYTPELGIFDLFEIPIYHGWLVDPQEVDLSETVRNCSYNQLVEKIINDKTNDSQEVVRKALLAEQFLVQTASQLTYYGLCELNTSIKEDQLAVFFRNNHFNTLYMHNRTLYLLVTDQGFLQESQVVWETLNDVEGNSHFLDSNFRVYQKPEESPASEMSAPGNASGGSTSRQTVPNQVDSDYQLALSLSGGATELQRPVHNEDGRPNMTLEESDFALALRLQEEEDSLAAAIDMMQTSGGQPNSDNNQQRVQSSSSSVVTDSAVHRTVPRSASQPSHASGMSGSLGPQRRPVSQSTTRRQSGDPSCSIL